MLTVDLGNTRLKAILWRLREPATPAGATVVARFEDESHSLEAFESWLVRAAPALAALASVAAPARVAAVHACLARHVPRVLVAPPSGLENRCREPERVGQDRLYAAAAAADLLARSAIVVDAGTALTVDALRVDGATRAFLGGAIAPGPALLAAALSQGTARLPRVEPRIGARALGTVTEDAIAAGIGLGFRGAAERLVVELARETGLDEAPVVLTGGARAFLLEPQPFIARQLVLEADLVQRGLLAALLRAVQG